MKLVEAKKATATGQIPVSLHTIYKWNSLKTHPALVLKVAGKLFVDLNEWNRMGERVRDAQVKEAKRIHAGV